MEFVTSPFDGATVAYEALGSGLPTVVFIHGLVGDHHDFSHQIDHVARTHQVVAIDLPGSGASGRGRREWTMESFGEDAAAVANRLGLEDVVLVGHSLGGNVTVEAALRLGGRVRALIWVNSFRSLDPPMDDAQLEAWFAPFTADFAAAMDDLNRRNFGPEADPALVEAVTSRARAADQARTLGLLRSKFTHHAAIVDALSNLDVPIYAVNSDFKPNDEASFARYGVDLRVIPAVGHFVMMEDPDAFNTELGNILSVLGQPERHS